MDKRKGEVNAREGLKTDWKQNVLLDEGGRAKNKG